MINYYCLSWYFNIYIIHMCDCQVIKSFENNVIDVILMRMQYLTCIYSPWHINKIIILLSLKCNKYFKYALPT